ncbi:MAG: tRNA 2-selenouridine(34) synthase MnmH [Lachnospirales bacterium]
MKISTYEELFEKDVIFIDVRTPREFNTDAIPKAKNIPLMLDDEYAEVGTIYKQKSPDLAKKTAMLYVSKRLPEIYESFVNLSRQNKNTLIIVYCARGGMRSTSVGNLLSTLGLPIAKLDGGYKSYRKFVVKKLEEEIKKVKFVTLFGKTGCGKTDILHYLKEKNYDILDLEGCANHRGSLLGHIGLNEQHSQKKFETLVLDILLNRKSNLIFTEGESKRIGNIIMPNYIYDAINNYFLVEITSPLETRIDTISKMYISKNLDKNIVFNALLKMKNYMHGDIYKEAYRLIEAENYSKFTEIIMINYYDKVYSCNKENVCGTVDYNGDFEKALTDILKLVK